MACSIPAATTISSAPTPATSLTCERSTPTRCLRLQLRQEPTHLALAAAVDRRALAAAGCRRSLTSVVYQRLRLFYFIDFHFIFVGILICFNGVVHLWPESPQQLFYLELEDNTEFGLATHMHVCTVDFQHATRCQHGPQWLQSAGYNGNVREAQHPNDEESKGIAMERQVMGSSWSHHPLLIK